MGESILLDQDEPCEGVPIDHEGEYVKAREAAKLAAVLHQKAGLRPDVAIHAAAQQIGCGDYLVEWIVQQVGFRHCEEFANIEIKDPRW